MTPLNFENAFLLPMDEVMRGGLGEDSGHEEYVRKVPRE